MSQYSRGVRESNPIPTSCSVSLISVSPTWHQRSDSSSIFSGIVPRKSSMNLVMLPSVRNLNPSAPFLRRDLKVPSCRDVVGATFSNATSQLWPSSPGYLITGICLQDPTFKVVPKTLMKVVFKLWLIAFRSILSLSSLVFRGFAERTG